MMARQRKPAAQGGNVVPMPKRPTESEAIVAAVTSASKRQSDALTQQMREVVAAMHVRHREHAQQLVAIGVRMDRPTLDDFIEIGWRLLAAKGLRT
jgi:hypothetical protein